MTRFLPALTLAVMLALAGLAAAGAQSTPTPKPLLPAPTAAPAAASDYQELARVQLGNLRTCAADMYQVVKVVTDTLDSCAAGLKTIDAFVTATTPPPALAPFQMRLFMALRPCWRANDILRAGGTDVFWFMTAASYTQACYTAASDASVEWARVTGKMPIF